MNTSLKHKSGVEISTSDLPHEAGYISISWAVLTEHCIFKKSLQLSLITNDLALLLELRRDVLGHSAALCFPCFLALEEVA